MSCDDLKGLTLFRQSLLFLISSSDKKANEGSICSQDFIGARSLFIAWGTGEDLGLNKVIPPFNVTSRK